MSKILFIFVLFLIHNATNSINIVNQNDLKTISDTKITLLNQQPSAFTDSQCDMVTAGSLCLMNGAKVLLSNAQVEGLKAYYSFDDIYPIDSSGNKNHASGTINAGPSLTNQGSSALFSNGSFLTSSFTYDLSSSTISFWLFVMKENNIVSEESQYSIIQIGLNGGNANGFDSILSIGLNKKTKNLQLNIKSISTSQTNEIHTSNSRIQGQRWYHIALVKKNKNLKLLVNGIIDSLYVITGEELTGTNFISISSPECKLSFLIDELKFYEKALNLDFIQAEASPVLGGVEPNFLQIGCIDCSLKDAAGSCQDGYKICSSVELHTGGYQIARSLGLVDINTHIWTKGALGKISEFENLLGLGLCCLELK